MLNGLLVLEDSQESSELLNISVICNSSDDSVCQVLRPAMKSSYRVLLLVNGFYTSLTWKWRSVTMPFLTYDNCCFSAVSEMTTGMLNPTHSFTHSPMYA